MREVGSYQVPPGDVTRWTWRCDGCGAYDMTRSDGKPAATLFVDVREPVDAQAHYAGLDPQPWDVISSWRLGFCLGNVVKYIARADRKGDAIRDLEKARCYLDREIRIRKGCSESDG